MKYCYLLICLGIISSSVLAEGNSTEKGKSIKIDELGITFYRISPQKYGSTGSDYYLMETEVTNAMFKKYLSETGKKKGDMAIYALEKKQREQKTSSTADPVYDIQNTDLLWKNNAFPSGKGDLPVALLTERQASGFCDWLTRKYGNLGRFRIPTIDEWLIAAYGKDRKYPWGKTFDKDALCYSNLEKDDFSTDYSTRSPEPVKARPKGRTPEGLYGMWGNVHEIIQGHGGGVWKGGSYKCAKSRFSPKEDYWGYTHADTSYHEDTGFRVLLELAGKEQLRVESLHVIEKEKQRKVDYENRYNELPVESRTILRARSLEGDSDLSIYKDEVGKARENLDPNLINQLVILLGYDKRYSIEANFTLEDIYCKTWLIESKPQFLQTDSDRKKAIQILVDSFDYVEDSSGFDDLAHLFMRVSGIHSLSFPVDGTGIMIKKSIGKDGGYTSANYKWRKEKPKVIAAFRAWWSQQSKRNSFVPFYSLLGGLVIIILIVLLFKISRVSSSSGSGDTAI